MIVVADTGPINYLVLIGEIDLLSALYIQVLIPASVRAELDRPRTPESVRRWIASPPEWLEVRVPANRAGPELSHLDAGERDAILLAEELHADQLIMDEIRGRREAGRRQIPFTGTLGVLSAGSREGLIDLKEALFRLRRTSFHVSQEILDRLIRVS